jgi:hypothetical protein
LFAGERKKVIADGKVKAPGKPSEPIPYQERTIMLTDRFKALEEAVAQLPADAQDTLAASLEDALRQMQQDGPASAAIERALDQHAASLEYLKDE